MASDPIAPENHRGVAMFVVLGMVIFFTMLGIMGLEMASKDSQVSGSLVDIKTKEEAAWGGLNLAIGTMQANPAATVAQLQQFIADSSASASSKHQWFRVASGTFTLAISKPDTFATLAASGDPSGVIVRVVALYIGDVNGSDTGSGITITLESTGKGRNGDPSSPPTGCWGSMFPSTSPPPPAEIRAMPSTSTAASATETWAPP
jgi:hypothetical protein